MEYVLRRKDERHDTTKVIVETKDGDVARLVAIDGKPLSADANQAELERLELLEKNDIPCMRPHTLETLMEDPHLADAEFFRWVDHPSEGRIRPMREPSTWSETKTPPGRFAPRLGQHTREILAEAGFDPQIIDDLVERKIAKTD